MSYNRFEETTSKAKSPHGPGHSSTVLSEGENYYKGSQAVNQRDTISTTAKEGHHL